MAQPYILGGWIGDDDAQVSDDDDDDYDRGNDSGDNGSGSDNDSEADGNCSAYVINDDGDTEGSSDDENGNQVGDDIGNIVLNVIGDDDSGMCGSLPWGQFAKTSVIGSAASQECLSLTISYIIYLKFTRKTTGVSRPRDTSETRTLL